jgi:branched-chain amino acid transport system ATP-binding protein
MTTVLAIDEVAAGYGDFQALFDVSLAVEEGETVAIIGANGAGKSTLLRTIMGQVALMAGRVVHRGTDLSDISTHRRVARGLALVPEGRRLFPSLSVEENLLIGAHLGRAGVWDVAAVLDAFPIIAPLLSRRADRLSGGEQQSVAIGRALMSNPDVLLLDEVSLGLAPVIVKRLYETLPRIAAAGTTIVLVEQDITLALEAADQVHCMLEGRVSLSGAPDRITHDEVTAAYFGVEA